MSHFDTFDAQPDFYLLKKISEMAKHECESTVVYVKNKWERGT
jgi:hypothetical protein